MACPVRRRPVVSIIDTGPGWGYVLRAPNNKILDRGYGYTRRYDAIRGGRRALKRWEKRRG